MLRPISIMAFMILSLLACNLPFATEHDTTEPEIAFPRQQATDGEREVMEAQLFGLLVLDGSCLRVTTENESYLIIWPPGYALHIDNESIAILDASGTPAVSLGQQVYISGGEVPLSENAIASANVEGLADSGCAGPYWFAGEIVEPNN